MVKLVVSRWEKLAHLPMSSDDHWGASSLLRQAEGPFRLEMGQLSYVSLMRASHERSDINMNFVLLLQMTRAEQIY